MTRINWTNFIFILFATFPVVALDIYGRSENEGGQGSKDGMQLLYLFNKAEGNRIYANYGTLDLVIEDLNRAAIGTDEYGNYIDFKIETLVKSDKPATSLISACKASNELTIELWLKNDKDDQPVDREVPLRIATLSAASNNSNFFIGYDYDMAASFIASVRQGAGLNSNQLDPLNNDFEREERNHLILNTNDTSDNKILRRDLFQHVIFTYNANIKESRLFVSEGQSDPNNNIPIQRELAAVNNGDFSGWNNDFHLALGNEVTYNTDSNYPRISPSKPQTTEDRDWRGQIYLLAVYCKAHKPDQVLGDAAPGVRFETYKANPNIQISADHLKAAQLYNRIAGVKIPISAPIIAGDGNGNLGMADYIKVGDNYNAALMATNESHFYNITVKDFAKRMSTRDETVNTPLNDFVAMIVGVTRDDINAQQLLTGNFYYAADPNYAAVPANKANDLLKSNNHYQTLEENNYDLKRVLKKYEGQLLFNGTGIEPQRDPAGVLTSRAFLAAHAIAGTNRRLVEYTFREFLCVPMEGWSNSQGPDNWVGSDVDRFPGGDHKKFLKTCRGCHSNMDGFRGAFAKFNFANNFVKYADIMPMASRAEDEDATNMFQDPIGVAGKMNRNAFTYPCPTQADPNKECRVGHYTSGSSWVNNANLGLNEGRFGWNGVMNGYGVRSFGQMISKSEAYPKCLTKRVFRSVCKREAEVSDGEMIIRVAGEFKNDNYNLRRLFARVAAARECNGD